ncbi:MAG: patatin-like phospholipase family protein, partial [Bacteroidota bacterium]
PGDDALDSDSPKTVILSIDGGGIKGIIPAYGITVLEEQLGMQSYEIFDIIGGTSTGGILSIALTAPQSGKTKPRTAQEVLDIYLTDCESIFVPTDYDDVGGPKFYANENAQNIDRCSSGGVEIYLQKMLGTSTLSEAANMFDTAKIKQVFTTSYVINSSGATVSDPVEGKDFGPYLFNWMNALQSDSDDYFLWEAARSTSAAPTYFSVAHVGGGNNPRSGAAEKWAVDGGIMSNDPSMWAVAEAFKMGLVESLDDLVIVSLGCGLDPYNAGIGVTNELPNSGSCGQESGFWSAMDWGTEALYNLNGDEGGAGAALLMSLYANQFTPDNQLAILAQNTGMQYIRIQPQLPSALTDMADCTNTAALDSFAQYYYSSRDGKAAVEHAVAAIRSATE